MNRIRELYLELRDFGKIAVMGGAALGLAGCGIPRSISVRTDPPSEVRVEMEGQVFQESVNGKERISWELEMDRHTGPPESIWGAGIASLVGAYLTDPEKKPALFGLLLGGGLALTGIGIGMSITGREAEGYVRVEKEGYYPASIFFISNGRHVPEFEIELTRVREYPIELNSVPEGADVGVTRKRGKGYRFVLEGETPYSGRFQDLAGSGIGTFRIEAPGYREWVGNIDLERMPVRVGLERARPGTNR